MAKSKTEQLKVTQLGRQVGLPQSPEEATLDRVPNPHPDKLYLARFAAPEFTSLCPITGQPDFAHLVIDYAPRRWLTRKQVVEAVPGIVPQSRCLSRRLHGGDRRSAGAVSETSLAAHRWLLVSARWYSDRCVLADRQTAGRIVDSGSGRGGISGPVRGKGRIRDSGIGIRE